MGETLLSLLPVIIGSAVVPIQIIIVILLLASDKQGPLKAIAYVVGMTLARLAQGVLFGFVLTGGGGGGTAADEGSGWIQSTLLLVLGIFLLITAYRQFANEPDPDAPPPKWLTMLDNITPLTALLIGAGQVLLAAKLWVFTLSAISTIAAAGLGQPDSTITFLLFILLAQSLLIAAILVRLLLPTRADAMLDSLGNWLDTHNRQIVIVASLVFGLLFAYQGITGLMS